MLISYICLNCKRHDHREEDCPHIVIDELKKKQRIPKCSAMYSTHVLNSMQKYAEKINFLTLDFQDSQRQNRHLQKKNKNLEIELMIKNLQIKNLLSLV